MPLNNTAWEIPPSFDIGVPPFYRNILANSPLVKAYLRERIAHIDQDVPDKTYEALSNGKHVDVPLGEQPRIAQHAVYGMFKRCLLDDKSHEAIKKYIIHLAYNHVDTINVLRLKEFLAYCGVDGVYDLEKKNHFKVPRRTQYLPMDIHPSIWMKDPNPGMVRESIALMCDEDNVIPRLNEEIDTLHKEVWGEYIDETINRINTGLPVKDFSVDLERRRQYLEARPHLASAHDRWQALTDAKEKHYNFLLETFAPLDEKMVLPETGIEFDYEWNEQGERAILDEQGFRDKYLKHWETKGLTIDSDEYVPYNNQILRSRTYTIKDWALRDYTLNAVNRTINTDHRRHDLPRAFVDTVKAELEDEMLSICGAPNRIERVEGDPDSCRFIINNTPSEIFSLSELRELEKTFEENEGISDLDPNGFLNTGRRNPKTRDPALGKAQRDQGDEMYSFSPESMIEWTNAQNALDIEKQKQIALGNEINEADYIAPFPEPISGPKSLRAKAEVVVDDNSPDKRGSELPGAPEGLVIEAVADNDLAGVEANEPPGRIIDISPKKRDPVENDLEDNSDLPFPDAPVWEPSEKDLEYMDRQEKHSEEKLAEEKTSSNKPRAEGKQPTSEGKSLSFGKPNPFRQASHHSAPAYEGGGHNAAYEQARPQQPRPRNTMADPTETLIASIGSLFLSPFTALSALHDKGRSALSSGKNGNGPMTSSTELPASKVRGKKGQNWDDLFVSIEKQAQTIDGLADTFESGKIEGSPLDEIQRMRLLNGIRESMINMGNDVAQISDIDSDHFHESNEKKMTKAKSSLKRARKIADEVGEKKGPEGDLAKDIKDLSERLIAAIEKLIEAILALFGFKPKK